MVPIWMLKGGFQGAAFKAIESVEGGWGVHANLMNLAKAAICLVALRINVFVRFDDAITKVDTCGQWRFRMV
jgi:hypothetical protein